MVSDATSDGVSTEGLKMLASELLAEDADSGAAVSGRVADILRPGGALARMDAVAVWLAGWQRTSTPAVDKPAALVFAGDHGVTGEGVSAYPAEVTGLMLAAFNSGRATISALASVAGATVRAIDVGVGEPTGNIRHEPAMDQDRFDAAWRAGSDAVAETDTDLLILGEMGIGNTTAAAAVSAAMCMSAGDAVRLASFVGRGTGVDDEALASKTLVVRDALARMGETDPISVLREVGGTELVAIAGAMAEARKRSIPVLLDGYIATAPALVLHAVDPAWTEHMRAAHRSAEPGHRLALENLGKEPLLELDFRLGEASGAMIAVPLLQMACRGVTDVATFTEWFADNPPAPAGPVE